MSDAYLKSLATAVESNPRDPMLRMLFAQHLKTAGKQDEAVAQALVVLSLDANHPEATAFLSDVDAGNRGRAWGRVYVGHPRRCALKVARRE